MIYRPGPIKRCSAAFPKIENRPGADTCRPGNGLSSDSKATIVAISVKQIPGDAAE
jgi:hypothetical protein